MFAPTYYYCFILQHIHFRDIIVIIKDGFFRFIRVFEKSIENNYRVSESAFNFCGRSRCYFVIAYHMPYKILREIRTQENIPYVVPKNKMLVSTVNISWMKSHLLPL